MKRPIFYTELAYLLGIAALALGTALMAWGGFGISIVVAPAYVLHLATGLSFGAAEYVLQGIILLLMLAVVRRVRLTYFLSFATALLYGALLDACVALCSLLPQGGFWGRFGIYSLGLLLCALGVSLLFRTYFPPAVYELFVKTVSGKFGLDLYRFKTGYDCVSCIVAVLMSLLFFGALRGIGIGTLAGALGNGILIRFITNWLQRTWEFRDGLPLHKYFAKET